MFVLTDIAYHQIVLTDLAYHLRPKKIVVNSMHSPGLVVHWWGAGTAKINLFFPTLLFSLLQLRGFAASLHARMPDIMCAPKPA